MYTLESVCLTKSVSVLCCSFVREKNVLDDGNQKFTLATKLGDYGPSLATCVLLLISHTASVCKVAVYM